MARKYLNELGINDEALTGLTNDELREYEDEIKEYGFGSYETWNLDYQFYAWLYERLKEYVKVSSPYVALDYHRFEYEGKEYTQIELIEKMIQGCEYALTEDEWGWSNDCSATCGEHWKEIRDVGYIWALVMPVMWW